MADARGDGPLPAGVLAEIERMAVEFAQLAGDEIVRALGRTLEVRYKGGAAGAVSLMDPVSEVDHEVERLIRLRLAETFPEHDIVGEEVEERTGREHDVVWVIDPIDGTTNFVNGFPLFAASIGVLCRGQPVAGALWCSTGHLLRHGVYHARLGAHLLFDGEPLEARRNVAVRRRLAGEPEATSGGELPWDTRKTGSAAIECAFVAAGLLEVARFERPNVWDVGGGVALVQAAGGEARTRTEAGWVPLERFEVPAGGKDAPADLRGWRQPLIVGERSAVDALCQACA
jgi:myo-inositol-1(or 4)-monophosphatase